MLRYMELYSMLTGLEDNLICFRKAAVTIFISCRSPSVSFVLIHKLEQDESLPDSGSSLGYQYTNPPSGEALSLNTAGLEAFSDVCPNEDSPPTTLPFENSRLRKFIYSYILLCTHIVIVQRRLIYYMSRDLRLKPSVGRRFLLCCEALMIYKCNHRNFEN
jgi:hypothetical protein